MKKIIYILTVFALGLMSCEPSLEDAFEEVPGISLPNGFDPV